MDTTAAAELGGGVVEGGVGYWDAGVRDAEGGWTEKATTGGQSAPGWGDGGGGGSHGRGSRPAAENEPPFKRMRNMGAGEGQGGFGSGSGSYTNNVGHGGNAGGFGPSAGGSPSLKGHGSGGPGALPGTPSGDSLAGSGHGQGGVSRGRGMGSIFYKTKLCSRFRNGNCPYNTNCNFAHGMEELRKPPPGWEDVVAAQEGCGGGAVVAAVTPPPAPIQPSVQGSNGVNGERAAGSGGRGSGGSGSGEVGPNITDMQRFHKTRPCKKYFSELGCPYGDRCNFLHDEQNATSKAPRESVVVTVATNASASGSGGVAGGGGGAGVGAAIQRPPNWKTRLCNKWETTGNCPFGEKCHFAHGTPELQRYGGGPVDSTSDLGAGAQLDSKLGTNSFLDGEDALFPSFGEGYGMSVRQSTGLSLQRNSRVNAAPGLGFKSSGGWKGPTDRISTIYGDWVEEEEWEDSPAHVAKEQPNQGFQEGVEYPMNESSLPRERGGLSTSYGRYTNGQEITGQKSSLNQGNDFTYASRTTRVYAQGMQGSDMAYAQERGSDLNYNGTQDWGGELWASTLLPLHVFAGLS